MKITDSRTQEQKEQADRVEAFMFAVYKQLKPRLYRPVEAAIFEDRAPSQG